MAYYTTYNFPDHKSGDTFLGVIFHLSDAVGEPYPLEGASIVLRTLTPHTEELTTANGGISIIDNSSEADGDFMVNEQIIDWCPGNYEYEIVITFASGRVRTYIGGRWLITE